MTTDTNNLDLQVSIKHSFNWSKKSSSLSRNEAINTAIDIAINIKTSIPLSQGIVGVFGDSGAGKSTLLRILSGLEPVGEKQAGLQKHSEFAMTWQNKVFTNCAADKNPCLLQTQQAQLFPNLAVLQNLKFVLKHSSWSLKVPFTLEQVIEWCGIEALLNQASTSLSGGEQQRVNLARSLLCGKPIILLDEPFSALDWNTKDSFLNLLVHLQKNYPLHFIIVSHSLKELALCSQNLLHIHQGRLIQSGNTKQVINQISSASKVHSVFSTLQLVNPDVLPEHHLTKWQLGVGISTDNLKDIPFIYTKGINDTGSAPNSTSGTQSKVITLDANRVSLSRQANLHTSMLNHLEATIDEITHIEHMVLVKLNVQEQTLYAEISQLSFSNLQLQLGETVYCQFKAL